MKKTKMPIIHLLTLFKYQIISVREFYDVTVNVNDCLDPRAIIFYIFISVQNLTLKRLLC